MLVLSGDQNGQTVDEEEGQSCDQKWAGCGNHGEEEKHE